MSNIAIPVLTDQFYFQDEISWLLTRLALAEARRGRFPTAVAIGLARANTAAARRLSSLTPLRNALSSIRRAVQKVKARAFL